MLRGINVGGGKKILMADLKKLYEQLGFKSVTTYIQSGNVIFKAGKNETEIAITKKIEAAITAQYNFDAPVIVRSTAEMEVVLQQNPFLKDNNVQAEKLHVTFLAAIPETTNQEKTLVYDYQPDEFIISGREVYLHIPYSYGETKLSNKFFESKLKTTATTRNWKTVCKLAELAKEIE